MTGNMGKAAANYRNRTRDKGLARVEVSVPESNAALVRRVAEKLKVPGAAAEAIQSSLDNIVRRPHSAR